ncbi:hypothetical protein [Candidatus Nitrotoga arctica]|uniref:Uncharacterized protein n=1 Tax=Candidatus Nitrotoga arctica TaxID=453162 RepID=A0ABM8Z005_9PROT|nr:hypothetical protein [Candidatus Nitrotoga arctica]CAG9933068.1 protein of unknown function [Candidatus Nitrotoga arctica]
MAVTDGYLILSFLYFCEMKKRTAAVSNISIIFRANDRAVAHTDKAPSLMGLTAIAAIIKDFQIIFAPIYKLFEFNAENEKTPRVILTEGAWREGN